MNDVSVRSRPHKSSVSHSESDARPRSRELHSHGRRAKAPEGRKRPGEGNVRFDEPHVRSEEGHVTEEKPSNSGFFARYIAQNDGYNGIWGFGARRRLRRFIKPRRRNTAANVMSSQSDVVTG